MDDEEDFYNHNFNVGSPSLKRNSKNKEKKETSKKRSSNSSSSSCKISFDSFVLLVVRLAYLPIVPPEFIKNYCTGSKKRLTIMFTKKLDNFDLLQEIYEGKVIILLIFDEYFFPSFLCLTYHHSVSMQQDTWLVLQAQIRLF
jgi:hypothetical protein